jgi:anti-sigma regulatory factor (Ser/Thr protein kinase)
MWTIVRERAEFCVEDHSVLTEPDDEDEERPRRRLHEILEEETGLKDLGSDVIQALMDEVTVETNPGGTVTKMVKSLR